jgi:hypothetical protein
LLAYILPVVFFFAALSLRQSFRVVRTSAESPLLDSAKALSGAVKSTLLSSQHESI